MPRARILLLTLSILLLFGRAGHCQAPPDLQKAVVDGIKMLEDKSFLPFLKRYIPPKERTEMKIDDPDFVHDFTTARAPVLLRALKFAAGLTPTITEDGKLASYDLKGMENAPDRPLLFRKYSDGLWYIDN